MPAVTAERIDAGDGHARAQLDDRHRPEQTKVVWRTVVIKNHD
jgi:hypothetical protein